MKTDGVVIFHEYVTGDVQGSFLVTKFTNIADKTSTLHQNPFS